MLTAADRQTLARGKVRDTGYFLGEFYEAHRAVTAAGFRVAFATPGGRVAPVDPESLDPKYWEAHPAWLAEAKAFVATDPGTRSPMTLDAALAAEQRFAALVVPGGQGVMSDLVNDPTLHALVERFADNDRPIGLICHAPALLAHLPSDARSLRGRKVTSVSGFEEFYIESFVMHGRARERGIGKRLRKAGFVHVAAGPGKPFATRDRNLVTSQNPFSGDAFAQHFTAALAQWRDQASDR
ncbi:MAG: type 1 glutamine amidotransferase domain-containing protein [Deltaproteobacteria bacterium]|nr:type 1 glutamine amidotransferase domain-containing protein [Nannocystaceae bacterium]